MFSYQLYSSRNFPPLSNTLEMVCNAGYQQVEGYGDLLTVHDDPYMLRDLLDSNNLNMATCHFDFESLKARPKQVIEFSKILNMAGIYIPFLRKELRPTNAAGWVEFGKSLSEIGKPFRDAGLVFGWHNHEFEFKNIGTVDLPIDLILSESDHLSLELDVAWAVIAGSDPTDLINRYGNRITAVHIKDIAPEGHCLDEDGWADVGQGTLDWSSLYVALKAVGTRFFVIEHDNPSDDKRFAERSLAYIEKL